MILLPGTGEFHSKILWWNQGEGNYVGQLDGRVEGWIPSADDGCQSFAGFFCSSLIHLADGRALLSGGTAPDLPVASPVTLEVFDLLGRRVATLARASTRPVRTRSNTISERQAVTPCGRGSMSTACGQARSRRGGS